MFDMNFQVRIIANSTKNYMQATQLFEHHNQSKSDRS